jgi:hypothetical protein
LIRPVIIKVKVTYELGFIETYYVRLTLSDDLVEVTLLSLGVYPSDVGVE